MALPARNLLAAQKRGYDVMVPCAACFNRFKAAEHHMEHDPDRRRFFAYLNLFIAAMLTLVLAGNFRTARAHYEEALELEQEAGV